MFKFLLRSSEVLFCWISSDGSLHIEGGILVLLFKCGNANGINIYKNVIVPLTNSWFFKCLLVNTEYR